MAPLRLRPSQDYEERSSLQRQAQSITLSFTADDGRRLAELAGEGLAHRRGHALRPGWRPVHTRGVILKGTFESSGEAGPAAPEHLKEGQALEVIVRFSSCDAGLDLDDRRYVPRGLAVRFLLEGGRSTDLVSMSTDRFPATTVDAFTSVSRALSSPLPLRFPRLGWLWATHQFRGAWTFATCFSPSSYGRLDYYAIHTFLWAPIRHESPPAPTTTSSDNAKPVRYRWRSVIGSRRTWPWTRLGKQSNYLEQDLCKRLGNGDGVDFELQVQFGDGVSPSRLRDLGKPLPRGIPWKTVGRLHIDRMVDPDEAAQLDRLVFNPSHLIEGIEPYPADEIMTARTAAYAASHVYRATGSV